MYCAVAGCGAQPPALMAALRFAIKYHHVSFFQELDSSKRLISSSVLDVAQNEKKKHCPELKRRKWRRQENEGGGDAQRRESDKKKEVGFTEEEEGMCWQNEDTLGMRRLERGEKNTVEVEG